MKHAFACGVRPPHLLKRREFEDNLAYDMMLHHEFDIDLALRPRDEVFADSTSIRDLAANKMLDMPTLRKVLPTIRRVGMAYNFEYQPIEPCLPDQQFCRQFRPWVTEETGRLGRNPAGYQSCAQRFTFFDGRGR
jgi:hypothetical protein